MTEASLSSSLTPKSGQFSKIRRSYNATDLIYLLLKIDSYTIMTHNYYTIESKFDSKNVTESSPSSSLTPKSSQFIMISKLQRSYNATASTVTLYIPVVTQYTLNLAQKGVTEASPLSSLTPKSGQFILISKLQGSYSATYSFNGYSSCTNYTVDSTFDSKSVTGASPASLLTTKSGHAGGNILISMLTNVQRNSFNGHSSELYSQSSKL